MNQLHTSILRYLWIATIALMSVGLVSCRSRPTTTVTVTLLQCRFFPPDELRAARALPDEFHRQTGLTLEKLLGVPGESLDQLSFIQKQFLKPANTPDVVEVDETWLGALKTDFADSGLYLPDVVNTISPAVEQSYKSEGRFIAIPYQNQVGVLAYRADLLRKYGYDHPPATWAELEKMSLRIQSLERNNGKKNFWGYVWAGAAEESLTCAALEWQVDEGGGSIIEPNGTISVNNSAAIRSWERARHWIGWISPTNVADYREFDALEAFVSGRSAFVRMWAGEPGGSPASSNSALRLITWGHKLAVGEFGISALPGGSVARTGVLGGIALAISKSSSHPQADATLVRFLLAKQSESFRNRELPFPSPESVLYYPAGRGGAGSQDSAVEVARPVVITRPTNATGSLYDQVSRSYFLAIHSVLTGKQTGPEAAANLEGDLVRYTGFHPGPPTLQ